MGKFKKAVKNILPYYIVKWIQDSGFLLHNPLYMLDLFTTTKAVLGKNTVLHNKYKNERCFVLCTGPSINQQAIEKLKNEVVFGVSTGFLHKKYSTIHPTFHCTPQCTYTELFTKEAAINLFRTMDEHTFSDTKFIFSDTERKLIEENQLFRGKELYYVSLSRKMRKEDKEIYDISKRIPGVTTVPVMAIIVAMYMGFNKIYLLGTECDSCITKQYVHAMQEELSSTFGHYDYSVDQDNNILANNYEAWEETTQVLFQFRVLHQIAIENGIEIINATIGGIVDEFPRIDFNDLFF